MDLKEILVHSIAIIFVFLIFKGRSNRAKWLRKLSRLKKVKHKSVFVSKKKKNKILDSITIVLVGIFFVFYLTKGDINRLRVFIQQDYILMIVGIGIFVYAVRNILKRKERENEEDGIYSGPRSSKSQHLISFEDDSMNIYHEALSSGENPQSKKMVGVSYPDDILIKDIASRYYLVLFYRENSREVNINYVLNKPEVEKIIEGIRSRKKASIHIYRKASRTHLFYRQNSYPKAHGGLPKFLN